MNIVILGAGTVGQSIAEILCAEGQNVTIVDRDRRVLDQIEERLDVQTVCGSASDAVTLFQAGTLSAELCLCVTNSDEVNLVGGSLAKSMGARRSVARTYNPAFRDASTFDYRTHFGIDRLLSLERLTALELAKGIRPHGLFGVEYFARGEIEVHEVAVDEGAKAVGIPLRDLKMPPEARIGLISNAERTIIAGADDVLKPGDHATLIGNRKQIEHVKKMFEHKLLSRLNVVIAGGGEIGFHLAELLQSGRYHVTLMEADVQRCEFLAGRLERTTVLHADVTRQNQLEENRVGNADVFVAATGHDENNIVAGIEARELGAKRIISVVRRPDHAKVLHKLGVDVAVSPRQVMARQILGMLDAGPIIARSYISGGEAEVWEVEILAGVPVTQAPLKELNIPHALVAAIVYQDYTRVPGADDQMHPGETAVLLVQQANARDVLRLFEPAD
ncbi:MAG: Trk system potassium transporter TrkA [Planctomycetaceae bacterium]